MKTLKLIGSQRRVPVISRNPHPNLIALPQQTTSRKEQIEALIAHNCPKQSQRSLLKAYRMFIP